MESAQSPTEPAPGRLTRLDGLRGIAACGVAFLYHPQVLFSPGVHDAEAGLLHWFHGWGWTLVDLFFLISGYIFAHVYLGRKPDGEGYGLDRSSLGDFAAARFARLYPLHLLTLCLCAVVFFTLPVNTPEAFAAHLLMMQAFVQPTAGTFNGPSWSISIEVVCYVLFALGAVRGRRVLCWVTAIAMALALVHFLLQGRPGGPWVGDSLPRGLLGFFLGQTLWHLRGRLARASTPLLAGMMIFGLAVDMGTMSSLLPLTLFAWPAVLLLALRVPFMGSGAMQWLGDRSYAIYLVHFPVLLMVRDSVGLFAADLMTELVVTLAFGSAVLALSDLCYRFVECPSRRAIRAAWARRRAPDGVNAGTPA